MWGTWLNEEIEETEVRRGSFAMWRLGCTGVWVKFEGGADLCIDAVLANHDHGDHIDINVAAAVLRNCGELLDPNPRGQSLPRRRLPLLELLR